MDLFFFFLQSLFPFLLLSLSLYLYSHFIRNPKSPPTTNPFLIVHPYLGNLLDFIKNRHRFLEWTTDILTHSPTQTFTFRRPGNVKGVITANPSNVEHMLKTNFTNFPKGPRFIFFLQDFLGRGIFNSDNHLWLIQRKTASFEFNTRSLRNFIIENVRTEIQTRLIPLLAKSTVSIDLQDVFERFAFDNICKLAFDFDPGCLRGDATAGREFMLAFEEAASISAGRFMYTFLFIFHIKRLFKIGSEKKLQNSIKIVHEFADKIIKEKLRGKNNPEADLVSRFIAANVTISDSESASESPEFLRDVVISFILAGRDTTSSALTWFFWLLSLNPRVERNILEEIATIRKRNGTNVGDIFELEELRDMHYLHAAISEAMRLYPPVAVDTKACLEDDIMPDGTFVGKGWFATYDTYAMGRLESIWGKDCREFVPERWLDNGTFRAESSFRYPVFHAGPRMCLGKDMAYIQMKSVAACVIERFEIDVIGKEKCPDHVLSLTLRMKEGLIVKVQERNR